MINFPKIEEDILKFWQEKDIFKKSLAKESPRGDFSFYDGPPFATGLPHYGHIVASLMKDLVPRYWTMKGYHVERKWGWDCHGLPIENIVEQELKLKNKKDIEDFGVDKFNERCRAKVLQYADEWRRVIDRLGRWVDMAGGYKTMDKNYMESIWWVFKQLWDKGLIYEGYKSMHICPRCETTLSQSEVGQGYEMVKDLSATAKFELADEPGTFVLSWTTTPWTLPGNVALAVGANVNYVQVTLNPESENIQQFILAKDIFEKWPRKSEYQIIKEFKGKALAGKKYKPLFDYFYKQDLKNKENGWQIYSADFVNTEEGTGIVHIAPGFGEDDYNLSLKEHLPFVQHVKMDGRFTEDVTDFVGQEVKPKDNPQKTDVEIIKYLAHKNLLFSKEKYEHSYPHCWRCDSPLLNYATSSWFVKVEAIKDKLLKQTKKINWVPGHIKEGRFGKWLAGARDWSISRQRFWGSVMPIWVCQNCKEKKIFGSAAELEQASGKKVNDLHKHFVDKIEFKCQKCSGVMKRIPDVLDCWFESGSMPYAQLHYPFENKDRFGHNFPAQFIAEGADQTRAWFYYLHVLAVILKGSQAFRNVIVNGIVLAQDGKKMSKKLNNYPDPMVLFHKYGADAMRYYLSSSSVMKADDLNFSENDVATVYKKVLLILGNVLAFYKMFEDPRLPSNKESKNILDQWIVAKTALLIAEITEAYDNYDLVKATRPLGEFINQLSTWYLRRSRDRFKSADSLEALGTLKYVLENLAKVMAPVMPFTADYLYQQLGKEKESVHLESWPKAAGHVPKKILENMAEVRKIVELALAKRDEAGIKVRQPLNWLSVTGRSLPDEFVQLIKDEVNVKEVVFKKGETIEVELDTKISDDLKAEGLRRELVRTINQLRKEAQLTVNDKIIINFQTDSDIIKEVIGNFNTDLLNSTISSSISSGKSGSYLITKEVQVNGETVWLGLVHNQ